NNENCIQCNLCHIACEDGAHQCIDFTMVDNKRFPIVDEHECVGCNLCYLVCPAPGAISMVRLDDGSQPMNWKEYSAAKN
ncbi:MAG TPA: 4Fe-4S dicluster-binding protein, partial [Pyrinomonadaceae bacterium]